MESKDKYRLFTKVVFASAIFLLFQIDSIGQSTTKFNDSTISQKASTDKADELLDTDETLMYVGEKMMYQLKKKLHLSDETDEAEEKKRKEKAKNVKFSLFGITIEK